jgi:hypothetical protein
MKRIEFLKKSIISGVAAMAAPLVLKSNNNKASTFNTLMDQVGFNHMPNDEINTESTVLHRAHTRGSADHGWLKVNHTFSFANYRNPQRMNFRCFESAK